MATQAQPTRSGVVPYRLTARQVFKMIDAGVFPEGAHVELLGGMLVDEMLKYEPHNFTVYGLGVGLRRILPADWLAREEKSISLGRFWHPEPDIAVVRGPDDLYRKRTPRAADVGLLVEVADVSYAKDRGVKRRGYAAAGIQPYWIANLPKRQVEVFGNPAGRGAKASYRDAATYGPDDEVPVVIEGRQVGRVAVRDVLP